MAETLRSMAGRHGAGAVATGRTKAVSRARWPTLRVGPSRLVAGLLASSVVVGAIGFLSVTPTRQFRATRLVSAPQGTPTYVAGNNSNCGLGNGTCGGQSDYPVAVSGVVGAISVALGGDGATPAHGVAATGTGTVWAWGRNNFGQLGDGSQSDRAVAVHPVGLPAVSAVAAGSGYSLFLAKDGTVWATGQDFNGQLGDGSSGNGLVRTAPVQVVGVGGSGALSGVVGVAAGNLHGLAVTGAGQVYAWGDNGSGELGNGTTTSSASPVLVSGLTGVIQVSAGISWSLALKSDGTVWSWGANGDGRLGDGSTAGSTTPVQVSGLTGMRSIAAGSYHGLATGGSAVYAWGENYNAQLGDGQSGGTALTPQLVHNINGALSVAAGSYHSLAVTTAGNVYGWGDCQNGELGNGQGNGSSGCGAQLPVLMLDPSGSVALSGVSAIAAGDFNSAAYVDGPVGGAPSDASVRGAGGCTCSAYAKGASRPLKLEPVDPENGNFTEQITDVSIPGRGRPLSFARSYNSNAASVGGALGFGWVFNAGMSLAVDATTQAATITQEDGAQTVFSLINGAYAPLPRDIAALTKNADGTFTLVRQRRETITFSASGQETRDADLNGYAMTFGYAGGVLISITDASSRILSLSYQGSVITKVTDPIGRTVQYGYNDGNGNLTDVTDVGGRIWHYSYDASHRLLTVTDPRSNVVTTNHYDGNGRVDWQMDGLQRKTTLAYAGTPATGAGGTTLITDPKQNQELITYQFGLRAADTRGYGSAQAATSTYTYDPVTLQPITVTDPNGNVATSSYDADGEVLTTTDALSRTTTRTYDTLHDLLTITDPLGVTTTMAYDARGNLTGSSRPDTADATTAISAVYHDDATHPGDVTRTVDPIGKTAHYTYDQFGLGLTASDPLGDLTISCHDTVGRPTWAVAARGTNGLIPATVCAQALTQEATTIASQTPPAYTSVVSYLDPATHALDGYGDVHASMDANGHITARSYDPDRNVVTAVDALGKTTTNVYDAANQETQTADGVGTPQQRTLKTDYNLDGSILDQIDGAGATTTYGYDGLARVTSMATPPTAACGGVCTTTYAYDGAGNRLTQQRIRAATARRRPRSAARPAATTPRISSPRSRTATRPHRT